MRHSSLDQIAMVLVNFAPMTKLCLIVLCAFPMAATAIGRAALVPDGPWEMEQAITPGRWMPAVVPGTVLTTLVKNGVVPDPHYGLNNKLENKLIPDLSENREFYTATFRTKVDVPASYCGKTVWMRPEGINYRGEIYLNGSLAAVTAGMFARTPVDVTKYVKPGESNDLVVKVSPVDFPGVPKQKKWGAPGEWRNGGDGEIGRNVTMLMTAGWDFMFSDGIRDRNTGIWRPIKFFATGPVRLYAPYVRTTLNDDMTEATLDLQVEVGNCCLKDGSVEGELEVEIEGTPVRMSQKFDLRAHLRRDLHFTAKLKNPRLWWPRNKGPQNIYTAVFRAKAGTYDAWFVDVENKKKVSPYEFGDEVRVRFGVREAYSDQSGPGGARQFYVNRRKVFIRGTNWIPEAMLKADDARMERELRLTAESGVNMVRLWAGGIAESDRFYDLCDEYGLLVWQEFFLSGDALHPNDSAMYLGNVSDTLMRIRHHPSIVHYVASNESTEVKGVEELVKSMTGTKSWMMTSECDGVHDGSPYFPVNPMGYYADTASTRGSRVYGFSPEYGTCALPAADQCRKFMPEELLWPVEKNIDAWKYREGGGFDQMTEYHNDAVNAYGKSQTFDEYARKSQAADALAHRALWEAWNMAKGRATGVLFWYNNTPIPQLGSHAWDYDLDQTASFFAQKSALAPLHIQYEYLSNRVCVVSDIYGERRLTAKAEVYDFDSRKVFEQEREVAVPGESCVEAFTIPFASLALPKPHFIKLRLLENEKEIDGTFYWRSNSEWKGQNTVTGPCVGGFEGLSSLPPTTLAVERMGDSIAVRNTGDKIAFMVEVKALDAQGRRIVPTHYSDNFFSLLPGEEKTVVADHPPSKFTWSATAWNTASTKELWK